jgi:hypothetical protein
MCTGLQTVVNFTGDFCQRGNFDEIALMAEDGSATISVTENDSSDEIECHQGKNCKPTPDRECSVCNMEL